MLMNSFITLSRLNYLAVMNLLPYLGILLHKSSSMILLVMIDLTHGQDFSFYLVNNLMSQASAQARDYALARLSLTTW